MVIERFIGPSPRQVAYSLRLPSPHWRSRIFRACDPEWQKASTGIALKLRDTNGVGTKQVFNDAEREIALFDIDHFGRVAATDDKIDEVGICGKDRIAVVSSPTPDIFVVRSAEAEFFHMSQAGE